MYNLNSKEISEYDRNGIIYPKTLWRNDDKERCVEVVENCYLNPISRSISDRALHQNSSELMALLKNPRIVDPVSSILA